MKRAPLETVSTTNLFELITIDYLHLDQCKGGYKYLLVVVGHFTKFAQTFLTKNKSGRSATDMLFNKYFLDFGLPQDQGKEFDNKWFKRLSDIMAIKPSRTTPYHTVENRLCERMNLTLSNMLKFLPTNFKIDLKSHIKLLTFANNNTIHKTTGFSPRFLLFGRKGHLL